MQAAQFVDAGYVFLQGTGALRGIKMTPNNKGFFSVMLFNILN
jgi:hypothetical protein